MKIPLGWQCAVANEGDGMDLGHKSVDHENDIEGPVSQWLQSRVVKLINSLLPDASLCRVFTNWHTAKGGDIPHDDSSFDFGLTVVYYTYSDPRPCAGGHTLIYDAHAQYNSRDEDEDSRAVQEIAQSQELEVALAVRPLAGRLLLFDSQLLHQGMPPSPLVGRDRLTTCFKFFWPQYPPTGPLSLRQRLKERLERLLS